MRRGYDFADVDGNSQLEISELEIVLAALSPAGITPSDLEYVWSCLNPHREDYLTWPDFVRGLSCVIFPSIDHCCLWVNQAGTRITDTEVHASNACPHVLLSDRVIARSRYVFHDPRASAIMGTTQPNTFELVSLLIDSPVSQREESVLMDSLGLLERYGFRQLQGMHVPMQRDQAKRVLEKVSAGELHKLDDQIQSSIEWEQTSNNYTRNPVACGF